MALFKCMLQGNLGWEGTRVGESSAALNTGKTSCCVDKKQHEENVCREQANYLLRTFPGIK